MTTEQTTQKSTSAALPKHLFSILIIDDDQHLAGMLNRILSAVGYTCTCVFGADQALDECQTKQFDLIITDIHMPGMSGVEFVELLQARSVTAMIIFMTANAELMSITRAMTLEPLGYLEKPFKNDKLIELVGKGYERFCELVASESERARLNSTVQKKEQELRLQTEQLLAGEELLQGIISNANFGLIAVDRHLVVSLVNEMACTLLSQPTSNHAGFVGAPLIRLLPDSCRPQVLALCQSVMRIKQPQERTFTNPQSNRLLNAISYPILRNDHLQATVLIIQDITEKEQLHKNLLQSAKLASIGILATGIANEINSPLNTITNNVTTLSKQIEQLVNYTQTTPPKNSVETTATETRHILAEMNEGLTRVSRIVEDLKSYARPEDETPTLANINSLLDNALNLIGNEIRNKVDIRKSYTELPQLLCFPNRLVQVFTSIFVNAAQATEKNGVLTITTSQADRNININVKDNGHGIAREDLPRILEPFFGTKSTNQGTGMGLSISHSIVQRHNGTIDIKSAIGKGTEISITLPLQNGLKSLPEQSH